MDKHSQLDDGARLLLGGTVSLRFSFVTEDEERALARVYDAAMRDGLTGIYNRKALEERLSSEVAFAVRHVTPLSIALIDIDDFKSVNDAHGHLAGDAVIREVAARLARAVRTEDVVGRYGGEEFVVVARDISLEQAAQLAERLRRTLSTDPVAFEQQRIEVSASFGVASIACCGETRTCGRSCASPTSACTPRSACGRNRVVVASDARHSRDARSNRARRASPPSRSPSSRPRRVAPRPCTTPHASATSSARAGTTHDYCVAGRCVYCR